MTAVDVIRFRPPALGARTDERVRSLQSRRMVLTDRSRIGRPESSSKGRKLRQKYPKVRTGCANCKTRRIKCDETRPGCIRCQKFGIECNGYPPPPPVKKEPVTKKPTQVVSIVPLIKREPLPQHRPIRMHTGPRFTDLREGQYFTYFREEIAERMTGPLKTSLWNQLVPQAGELEPYVAHAIVAIGALSKSQADRADGQLMRTDQHQQYAMYQYGKALNSMRGALGKGTTSVRSIMISCLLVFSFESMQGRQAAAARSGASGLRLLYNTFTRTFGRKIPITDERQTNLMEFDLRRVFAEIDLQVLCFLDTRTKEEHDDLKDDINFLLQNMPAEFDNVPDCYYYWQLIMRRNLHFSATTRIPIAEEEFAPREDEKDPAVPQKQGNNPLCGSSEDMAAADGENFRPSLLAERDVCLSTILTWEAASAPLFKTVLTTTAISAKSHLSVLLLQIHAATSIIMTNGSFFVSELSYDAFFPQFRVIVENCSKVFPFIVNSSYISESGILIPLFQVGHHCRNRELREKAIDMMFAKKGYREGIWDAEFVGVACRAVWEEEKEWADTEGWVDGSRRVRAVGVQGSVEERWAKFVLLKGMGQGQDPVEVTRVFTW